MSWNMFSFLSSKNWSCRNDCFKRVWDNEKVTLSLKSRFIYVKSEISIQILISIITSGIFDQLLQSKHKKKVERWRTLLQETKESRNQREISLFHWGNFEFILFPYFSATRMQFVFEIRLNSYVLTSWFDNKVIPVIR